MTNNKQQMGVDFFYDEVWACFSSNLSWSECERLKKIKDQAKEIEREKAFEIFKAGQKSMEEGGKGFEQYYEQTYGGGNK
jgi:hypothetical protein